jgi:hypothetical protein
MLRYTEYRFYLRTAVKRVQKTQWQMHLETECRRKCGELCSQGRNGLLSSAMEIQKYYHDRPCRQETEDTTNAREIYVRKLNSERWTLEELLTRSVLGAAPGDEEDACVVVHVEERYLGPFLA